MNQLPEQIRITEVGPRDGLQNETNIVSVDDKVAFIDRLSDCGVAEIEVTSFVSPKWVPQLGDANEVLARIKCRDDVIYSALIPNEQGLDRALQAGVEKISVFTAASETFSRKNTNGSIAETLTRFKPVIHRAKASSLPVRAYISCVVACPYEGETKPAAVRMIAGKLLDLGVDEIDLGETIGVAAPTDMDRLYDGLEGLLSPDQTTLHLHDTRGTALACAYRAMQLGVRSFDASCGGLGGCPYAPGAAGNLATEDLVYLCQRMGVETNAVLGAIVSAADFMAAVLNRSVASRVSRAVMCGESSAGSSS